MDRLQTSFVDPVPTIAPEGRTDTFETQTHATVDSAEDIPTIRECLWVHPMRVSFRSSRLGKPVSELAGAAVQDFETGSYGAMAATAAIGSAAIATQTTDRIRIVIQKAPPEAIDKMAEMGFNRPSSLAAAAIVTGVFAVCNSVTGEFLNRAADRFPNLTDKFVTRFPRVTKAAQDAIPKNSEQPIDTNASLAEKALHAAIPRTKGGAWSRFKRGGMGILLGSTIFVGTAASEGVPVKERSAINAKVTRDASTILFGFVYGVAEGARQAITGGDPERAATIIHHAGSTRNWNIVSGAVIVGTIGINTLARRAAAKKMAKLASSDDNNGVEISSDV